MSDDKEKRDRALQRRVRERQAKTGESYQAAWRQLEPETSEAPGPTPEEDSEEGPSLSTNDAPYQAPTLDADRVPYAPRLVMPLASQQQDPAIYRIPPHQPTRITWRPTNGAFELESLHISSAGTPGGAADWVVNDIEIDGRSQLTQKDLPGALFGGRGVAAAHRASTRLSLHAFDPVERDHEIAFVMSYVGPYPEGVPFFGVAVGRRPPQNPTVIPIVTKSPLPILQKTTISVHVQSAPFQIDLIEINDRSGGADWIVNDLRINEKTQFHQSGDIPGDLFSTKAIDSFIKLDVCAAGSKIEFDVTYIGLDERGGSFAANLEGTVERDDFNTPPPDLRVGIEVTGQGPSDTVIATCNWRPPATGDKP